MNIADVLIAAQFKISEGADYCWDCYGSTDEVYNLDFVSTLRTHDTNSVSVAFNRVTGRVFEITAFDRKDNCFRWIDPQFVQAVRNEYQQRGLDFSVAYDEVQFVDKFSEEEILEIAELLILDQDISSYLEDSIISLDMTDSELALIARAAHSRNITINQFMVEAVTNLINQAGK